MITLSLLAVQKRLKNYFLPYDIAELVPLHSNFCVDQNFYICQRTSKYFNENCYTLQQLIRIENINMYDSIILSDSQYSLVKSYETVQKDEGSILFVLMWYFLVGISLYWLSFRV